MASGVIATNSIFPARDSWPSRIAVVALLTALADWLFFRQFVGIAFALFILALGIAVLLANRTDANGRERAIYAGILVVALLPSLEAVNLVSVLIAAFGIACFALGVTAALKGGVIERFMTAGWLLVSGPLQILRDLFLLRQWMDRHGRPASFTALKGWVVPLGFGVVFLALFAAANPVIAHWLAQWTAGDLLKQLDLARLVFWGFVTVAVWGFVGVSGRFALPRFEEAANAPPSGIDLSSIFNEAAIMRSLVLFNLLFAVQTVMDVHYLWRGAELPAGMTYATYAHRGAYPLIVTALLAAAFVLAAMRPGSEAERRPLMRALVFFWVGQNVLLVGSAMLRLNLYVETYLLTYWRVAAFVWMLIVAAGLVLIVVRIVTYRSNAWLISANAVVLALTIYVCSFINLAGVIADYNVAHAGGSVKAGHPIDLTYIASLGPQAIPALDRYFAANPTSDLKYFRNLRNALALRHAAATANWRAWTFRGWRLTRYLDQAKRAAPLTPP